MSSKRIAVVADGTRGDVQPSIVLALELQARSHTVRIITNCNHKSFVDAYGLSCDGAACDLGQKMKNKPALGQAFMKGAPALAEYLWGDSVLPIWRALDEFKPGVVVYGMTTIFIVSAWCEANKIPKVGLLLQLLVPTKTYPPAWFAPHLPYKGKLENEDDNWGAWSTFFEGWAMQQHGKLMREKFFEEGAPTGSVQSAELFKQTQELDDFKQLMEFFLKPSSPIIFGVSEAAALPFTVGNRPKEYVDKHVLSGFLTMDKALQERAGEFFGGGEALQEFVKRAATEGKDMLYVGWGSMEENMDVKKAVLKIIKVLKTLKKRAVVVSSFIGENVDSVFAAGVVASSSPADGQTEDPQEKEQKRTAELQDLRQYADEELLFLKSVAHEVLFPLCTCILHQGGCGTSACSLRSGRPTIITPVFTDQKQWAANVNLLQVGVGFKSGPAEVSDDELAAAIEKCCSDSTIVGNAQVLAEKLKNEDNSAKKAAGAIEAVAVAS